jgi:hypothetical protein
MVIDLWLLPIPLSPDPTRSRSPSNHSVSLTSRTGHRSPPLSEVSMERVFGHSYRGLVSIVVVNETAIIALPESICCGCSLLTRHILTT